MPRETWRPHSTGPCCVWRYCCSCAASEPGLRRPVPTRSPTLLVELLHEDSVSKTRVLQGLAAWYTILWAILAIAPYDRQDWLLENLLALAAVVLLLWSHRWFEFSTPSYILITGFLTLHAIGAHYTYAEVPFGHWLQRTFDLTRNPF